MKFIRGYVFCGAQTLLTNKAILAEDIAVWKIEVTREEAPKAYSDYYSNKAKFPFESFITGIVIFAGAFVSPALVPEFKFIGITILGMFVVGVITIWMGFDELSTFRKIQRSKSQSPDYDSTEIALCCLEGRAYSILFALWPSKSNTAPENIEGCSLPYFSARNRSEIIKRKYEILGSTIELDSHCNDRVPAVWRDTLKKKLSEYNEFYFYDNNA